MLVLTRKKTEMIQIGDNVFVKIIDTGRGSVKIGIDAPNCVRVLRGELSIELSSLSPGESLAGERPVARLAVEPMSVGAV